MAYSRPAPHHLIADTAAELPTSGLLGEGMTAYAKDTDTLYTFDGTTWIRSGPSFLAGTGTAALIPAGIVNVQTSATGIGNGADTSDDTLFTYSLPLNSMSANGKSLHAVASGHFATNANTKRVKFFFAGTAVADSAALTLSNVDWICEIHVTRITATTVSCVGRFTGSNVADVVTVTANLTVSDLTANASIIKITGASTIIGAANDVLGYLMKVVFEN